MEAYLLQLNPFDETVLVPRGKEFVIDETSAVLVSAFLKKLTPSAVDVEFRALYQHSEDHLGIHLLQTLLSWFSHTLASAADFELLQAYLYRLLIIYTDVFIEMAAVFGSNISSLSRVHSNVGQSFRHLVQENICLLKLLSGVASI